MEKILAIYDSDVIYATRFMEYFKKKKDFNFEISAFTRKDSLKEFLLLHRIEILLIGNEIILEEISSENIKYNYQLVEDIRNERAIEQACIFKYQSAQAVMAEVIADYVKKENETQVNYNPTGVEIISVFSPILNAAKLSFAWSISTLLSESKKVLFVPLDLLPIQLLSSVDSTSQSLSEFIYYLKENPNIIMKMKSLLAYDGNLSYLTGLTHGFDLLSLIKEDICKWIEELKTHTDYQTVVFYLGYYADPIIELMNQSDSVFILSAGSQYEKMVLKEWEHQMDRIGFDTKKDKFLRIQVEEEDVQAPFTIQELKNSSTWATALRFIKKEEGGR
ncbi:MAG: hypothetical protein H7X99_03240 [Saprospiraceae bacterium]|nr:hypothetical protein [Saprospiraceae bacterium]